MLQNAVGRVRLRPTFTVTLFVLSRRRFPAEEKIPILLEGSAPRFRWWSSAAAAPPDAKRPRPRLGPGRREGRHRRVTGLRGSPSSLIHVAVRHRWRGRRLLLRDVRDQ